MDHSRSFRNSQNNSHQAHFATKGLEAIQDLRVQNTETPSFLIKIILLQTESTGDYFNRVSERNILLHNMIIKTVIFKLQCKELDNICPEMIKIRTITVCYLHTYSQTYIKL